MKLTLGVRGDRLEIGGKAGDPGRVTAGMLPLVSPSGNHVGVAHSVALSMIEWK